MWHDMVYYFSFILPSFLCFIHSFPSFSFPPQNSKLTVSLERQNMNCCAVILLRLLVSHSLSLSLYCHLTSCCYQNLHSTACPEYFITCLSLFFILAFKTYPYPFELYVSSCLRSFTLSPSSERNQSVELCSFATLIDPRCRVEERMKGEDEYIVGCWMRWSWDMRLDDRRERDRKSEKGIGINYVPVVKEGRKNVT